MNSDEKEKSVKPPRWATRLLEWYCREEILEDLEGDLNEYFYRNVQNKGVRNAKMTYIIDVFKFFRPYTIRKPKFVNLLTQWIMIGSYIKTSRRSLVRSKLFSVINIVGLGVSMSVGLLVLAFLSDMLSYDDFHLKKDRTYRVLSSIHHNGQRPHVLASGSVLAGKKIKEEIAGIESATLMRRGFGGDAKIGDNKVGISGFWADNDFFSVFDFSLIEGDRKTCLKDPYTMVLTESAAKKLFGNDDALGQTMKIDTSVYTVTGVMKDIPKLSHMRFESLVSFATVELLKPDLDGGFMSWSNVFSNYTYIALAPGTEPADVQRSIDRIAREENAALEDGKIQLELQPMGEIVTRANIGNPIGPGINQIALWVLGGLALVVILSACFNYTNLSIARSLRRAKEVGIRKVIGARRGNVLMQFVVEAVIIALLALVFAFLIFLLLRDQFMGMAPQLSELLTLELSPRLIIWFIALATVTGIVAGFFPAFFFSKINSIQALKDLSGVKLFQHLTLRKALIVVQYVFALIFITSTFIGYSQYKSFLTFDLGFSTENILNIRLKGNKADLLKKELEEIPSVTGVSQSTLVTSLGSIYGMRIKYKQDSSGVWLNFIDEKYLQLHQHKFVAGRNFMASPSGEENEAIVNQQLLKRFNIADGDPQKALGEVLDVDRKKLTIVGVVADFHYGTLENKIEPLLLRYSPSPNSYMNVAIRTDDLNATMNAIERAWKKIDNVHVLDAKFYDDQIEEAYGQFRVMVKVIGFLSFLAICIASLGLFGMVVFTTETRSKEISIRKVMGASEGSLVFLLGRGFLALLVVASLISLPVTYLFFDQVVLVQFAYHQPIALTDIGIGVVIVMLLAFLMIGSQTLKVARTNPANTLKNE